MSIKGFEPIDIRIAILFATVLLFVIVLAKFNSGSYSGKYDTDPANDQYIKGNLTAQQKKLLNAVICTEKKQSGKKVPVQKIRKIAGRKNYESVQAAYNRWRECRDLNRNKDRVIYPSRCP